MKKLLLVSTCILGMSFGAFAADIDSKAKQALLIDADTHYIMFDRKADDPMPPASMSKLMTAYMMFDAIKKGDLKLDDEFTVSDNAWKKGGSASGSSTMFLKPKQKVKVRDLLRGIIVQSGNDACIVVAENMAGSEEAFAKMATKKAKELGLKNTELKNSTGITEQGHVMSPRDLAILTNAIIRDFPDFFPIYSEKEFKYNGIKQGNRNPLLYDMPGADGMKTGHTEASGYGLTGTMKTPDGRRLIMVINGLKSMDERAKESKKLVGWGMAAFENVQVCKGDTKIEDIPVWLGKEKTVPAVVDGNVLVTIPRGDADEVTTKILYDMPVGAPVQKGQKLGTLVVTTPDNATYTYDLVAGKDIEKVGPFGKIIAVVSSWFKF